MGATATISVEVAQRDLKQLLEQLHPGDTVTLVDSEGASLAVMVLPIPQDTSTKLMEDWDSRWDDFASRVSTKWQSQKSALEVLSEMRR